MRIEFKSIEVDAAATPPSPRIRGGSARLAAALVSLTDDLGVVTAHGQRAWASVTFTGARHELVLEFTGAEAVEAAERFIAALPEHEFSIPRYLVADAAVVSVDHSLLPVPRVSVGCEILMLDEI